MELGVSGEQEESLGLVFPPDDFLSHGGLHNRVGPALGGVKVTEELGLVDLVS